MRAPDIERGPVRIWRLDLTAIGKTQPGHACIESYLIQGPFHPLWSWWVFYAVHLRTEPGLPAPALHRPDASHEFAMWSWNPDHGVPNLEDVERGGTWGRKTGVSPFLSPPDFTVQTHALTDEQAGQVADLVVRAIAGGTASPDSDWREWWETAIENTARHARGECEPGEHLPRGDHGVSR